MRALVKLIVGWRDRHLVCKPYIQQSVVIKINSIHSESCLLGREVRRLPTVPVLFNIYKNYTFNN